MRWGTAAPSVVIRMYVHICIHTCVECGGGGREGGREGGELTLTRACQEPQIVCVYAY